MSQPDPEQIATSGAESDAGLPNTVAAIGFSLTVVALLMSALLLGTAAQLPTPDSLPETNVAAAESDDPAGSEEAATEVDNPVDAASGPRLRVLLLAIATAVVNLLGLVLCVVGLFIPERPRALAATGSIIALLLFIGIFGVMSVGAFLTL